MQMSQRSLPAFGTFGRLFQMRLPEIVYRGKQESFKWAERLGVDRSRRTSHADRDALDRFVSDAGKHFFKGPFDADLSSRLTPEHVEDIRAIASDAERGRFTLLGYRDLDLGVDPDWHFDPIARRRAAMVHWSRVDALDRESVGDSKVIWELNRHQWLVQLGQCYRLTGDERYARTIVRHLQNWIRSNPRGKGINWSSSLEAGFRLIAWCWTLTLIRDAHALTAQVFAEVSDSIRAHATHIERYLSYYFSPNTHLTGEALGLFYAGIVFPDFTRAAQWRSLGRDILENEINRQVADDGIYFERSTCYQRYTIDIYLHFMILARRSGIAVSPQLTDAVRKMVDALIALRQPDGTMPSIGDADGGLLLPLGSSRSDDYRATFSTAAVVFDEPRFGWAAGQIAPETLWLLGPEAKFENAAPANEPSILFPEGGYAVLRSGWDRNAHSLIFDCGPLGCDVSSGHGHADLLSIQCSAFGEKFLVDAGTGSYADTELRSYFRETAAHSTVMIDGRSQAETTAPFSWRQRPGAELQHYVTTDSFVYAAAEHRAYAPVVHRRQIAFIKSRYWIVIDDLAGNSPHRVDVRFQFAPMPVAIDDEGWVRATKQGRHGLLIRSFASAQFDASIVESRISPDYGRTEAAPALVYTANTPLPVRIVTLLWPAEDISKTPRAHDVRDAQGRPSGLTLPDRRETVLFEDGQPVVFHHP